MKNRFKEMSIGEEFECFASRKFEKGKSVESHNKTSSCFHGFSKSNFGERERIGHVFGEEEEEGTVFASLCSCVVVLISLNPLTHGSKPIQLFQPSLFSILLGPAVCVFSVAFRTPPSLRVVLFFLLIAPLCTQKRFKKFLKNFL
jgi:hypothetical protein